MNCFNFSAAWQAINSFEWETELSRTIRLYSTFSFCLLLPFIRASWLVVSCRLCSALQGNLANSFCSWSFFNVFYMIGLCLENKSKYIWLHKEKPCQVEVVIINCLQLFSNYRNITGIPWMFSNTAHIFFV